MEVTKAEYYSQYWGQPVIFTTDGEKEYCPVEGYPLEHKRILENSYLLLKPLLSITDEDLKVIGKMEGVVGRIKRHKHYITITNRNKETLNIYNSFIECCIDDNMWGGVVRSLNLDTYQYLQSKGYALPFRDFSEDKLIEKGWLRLVTI